MCFLFNTLTGRYSANLANSSPYVVISVLVAYKRNLIGEMLSCEACWRLHGIGSHKTLLRIDFTIMIKIEYPDHHFKIKEDKGKQVIFDALRKIWVRLTPEEWVRQNFLQYIVRVKSYPPSLIAIEKEMILGELKKRFDILVYDADHHPWMMIECKAMDILLDKKVLDQLLRYNLSIPVPFLVITNGSFMVGFQRKPTGLELINELPQYPR